MLMKLTTIRGQFHQPTGVKRKCAGAQHLAHKDSVQFHQQNCAQLYWSIELENPPNFYAVRYAPYASKLGVNLLVQKLLIKCWWNWPLVSMSITHPALPYWIVPLLLSQDLPFPLRHIYNYATATPVSKFGCTTYLFRHNHVRKMPKIGINFVTL